MIKLMREAGRDGEGRLRSEAEILSVSDVESGDKSMGVY